MTQVICQFAGLYVYRRRGDAVEFLLLHRAPGRCMAGTWQPVYGRIQPDETAWQAVVRELREETGLAPIELYHVDSVNTFYLPENDSVQHSPTFAAEVDASADVQLNPEHTAAQWLPPDEFARRLLWPGQRREFQEIIEEIIHHGPAREHLRIPLPPLS